MPRLHVSNFDGLVPRTAATELADNQAQVARNLKLYAREIRPWRGASAVDGGPPGGTTIFKLYNYAGASQWLSWPTDVDVALSPLTDTGDVRFYYTGDGAPKKSTYAMAAGPTPPASYYALGVPAPVAAPTLTLTTQGTGTTQTRAYVYTFISTFGSVTEESAPSPPESIAVQPTGSTVTVSLFDTPPVGDYNITAIRIYRSVTGASSSSYQFVAEVPVGTAAYADSLTVAQLGEVLATIGWLPPPDDLQGIANMTGTGVLVGFTGNTICFSEPYFPHAWPVRYQLTVPNMIVGLAVVGTSVVVMTDANPHVINGGRPGYMSQERVPILEPCVAKKSIVTTEDGVLYASPNGVVTIGSSGRGNTTRPLYHREEWEALEPQHITAVVLEGRYVAAFTAGVMHGKAIVLDSGDTPALCEIELSGPTAMHTDSRDAKVYFTNAANTATLQLDADAANLTPYTWRSKPWRMPQATSFSAMKMEGDFAAGSTTVAIYVDGALASTITPTSNSPIRLPPFKARELYFELAGTREVTSVTLATSVAELAG